MKKEAKESSVTQKKISKSLDLSVREGSYAAVATGLDTTYFPPYALAMNATSSQVGILTAVLNIIPSIVQMFGPGLFSKFSRKRVVLTAVMIKIILLIPIIVCGFLFLKGFDYMVWILIILVGVFYGLVAIGQPAWFSWMGSLVPEKRRGRYFSMRNRVSGFFGLASMLLGAVVLDFSKEYGLEHGEVLAFTLLGFGVIFTLAMIFKFLSWRLLSIQYEPKLKFRKRDGFTFWQFIKNAPNNPFGRFTIFLGFFSIAIGLASPFWAVYMLRDLGFSYFWFMAITVSGTLFQLMFLPLLGKFSDRFGNIKLMCICVGMAFVIPLLWVLSPMVGGGLALKLYLLFVPSIVSGFTWAGYNLAMSNYVYDAVSSNSRSFGVSYMNLVVGVGTFIGAGIGSALALLEISFMNTMLFIFLLSAILRFVIAFVGLGYLKEVRHVRKFNPHFFIREFRPMQGIVREFQGFETAVRKIEHFA
jgi:MFS family permease